MRPARWMLLLALVSTWWSAAVSAPGAGAPLSDRAELRGPCPPSPAWIDGSGSPLAIEQPRQRQGGAPERRDGLATRTITLVRTLAWLAPSSDRASTLTGARASHGRWTRGPPRV